MPFVQNFGTKNYDPAFGFEIFSAKNFAQKMHAKNVDEIDNRMNNEVRT